MNEAATGLCVGNHVVKFTEKNLRNFWRKVDKQGPLPDQTNPHYKGLDQCWIWTASKGPKGYGQWFANKNFLPAHRASWLIAGNSIPVGMLVLHRCDVPWCVNPEHLFIGTDRDNARDREAKGRGRQPSGDQSGKRLHPESVARGENNFKAKITAEIVREIRAKYDSGGYTHQALANQCGLHKSQVGRIVRRQFWRHVA